MVGRPNVDVEGCDDPDPGPVLSKGGPLSLEVDDVEIVDALGGMEAVSDVLLSTGGISGGVAGAEKVGAAELVPVAVALPTILGRPSFPTDTPGSRLLPRVAKTVAEAWCPLFADEPKMEPPASRVMVTVVVIVEVVVVVIVEEGAGQVPVPSGCLEVEAAA